MIHQSCRTLLNTQVKRDADGGKGGWKYGDPARDSDAANASTTLAAFDALHYAAIIPSSATWRHTRLGDELINDIRSALMLTRAYIAATGGWYLKRDTISDLGRSAGSGSRLFDALSLMIYLPLPHEDDFPWDNADNLVTPLCAGMEVSYKAIGDKSTPGYHYYHVWYGARALQCYIQMREISASAAAATELLQRARATLGAGASLYSTLLTHDAGPIADFPDPPTDQLLFSTNGVFVDKALGTHSAMRFMDPLTDAYGTSRVNVR
jgi:hypothetical protein